MPDVTAPVEDLLAAPAAAAEPAKPAEEFRPVVQGAAPTHTLQEVLDWILDKIGRL